MITGAYSLYCLSPAATGLELIALAVLLFVGEILSNCRLVCGICATGALAAGLRLLIAVPHRIALPLAITVAIVVGSATVILSAAAKQARKNKRAGIGTG